MEIDKSTRLEDIRRAMMAIAVNQKEIFVVKRINYVVTRLTAEPPSQFKIEREDGRYSLSGLQGSIEGEIRKVSTALQDLAPM